MEKPKRKNRLDLVKALQKASRSYGLYDSDRIDLNKLSVLVKDRKWEKALKVAHKMDTIVRDEIPAWGWKMLVKMVGAKAYIKRVNA